MLGDGSPLSEQPPASPLTQDLRGPLHGAPGQQPEVVDPHPIETHLTHQLRHPGQVVIAAELRSLGPQRQAHAAAGPRDSAPALLDALLDRRAP